MTLDVGLVADQVVRADGQGRVMLELARALVAQGHRATVYSRTIDPWLAVTPGIVWRPVRTAPGPQLWIDVAFVRAATRMLRRAEHDVVCVKGACAFPPQPFVYYASFSWHGWWQDARRAERPGLYHTAHAALTARRERRCLARAAAAIAVSQPLAVDLGRTAPGGPPVSVVPNGVDPAEFPVVAPQERAAARSRFGLSPGEYVVCFVGEYNTPRKGMAGLVEALAPGTERLLVAGDGPAARLAPLGRRAVALGHVSPVRAVFAAADVVAVPSLTEPFSLVALEAASSGLPVLVSARAGAASWLQGAAVLLDRPEDPACIRAAVDRVRSDPGLARALGARARDAAESMSWRTTAAAAVAVLERVAEERHPELRRVPA
jgi:UDP-glucose:(heptosyl)LPS alpha-1,3-glucosyltransferase